MSIDTLALLAGAARYTSPEAQWRAFGEVGAWGSPKVSANLSRSYLNNDDMVFAGSAVSGSLFSAYGRVGAIYAPDDANEIAFSARVTRSWLDLDGYREEATGDNLFAATVKGGRSKADTVSAEIAWSHDTGGQLDYTVSGAIGRTFCKQERSQGLGRLGRRCLGQRRRSELRNDRRPCRLEARQCLEGRNVTVGNISRAGQARLECRRTVEGVVSDDQWNTGVRTRRYDLPRADASDRGLFDVRDREFAVDPLGDKFHVCAFLELAEQRVVP